jgi:putative DNA primase/helicase
VVAEGIETALAVHAETGLSTWACVCASGLARGEIPAEVLLVRIYADNDPVGLDAAQALARRLLSHHIRVQRCIPPTPGADWLDVLNKGGVA